MNAVRRVAFVALAAFLAPFAAAGFLQLPGFGYHRSRYADIVNAIGVPMRHVTNMVTLVNYDVRGFDTLGEEFILFAAVTGVVMLLRGTRGEQASAGPSPILHRRRRGRSEAVTVFGRAAAAILLVFGLYVVLHAQITPGGGFQGGVILFAALLLAFFGEGYRTWRRIMRSIIVDAGEAIGTAIYLVAGLLPLLMGSAYLENILPLGQVKTITSGGLIAVVNLGVALAVTGGLSSAALELLEETRAPSGEAS